MARRAKSSIADAVLVDVLAPTTDTPPAVETAPAAAIEPPTASAELTAEQIRIRDLEDQLAKELGRKDPPVEPDDTTTPGADGNILIHFLEDGFIAFGQTWYRGQEIEIAPDSAAYTSTVDRTGSSWLALRNDEFGQAQRWGKVMFRNGPWPGKPLEAAANEPYEPLKPLDAGKRLAPTIQELAAAAQAEQRRRRAAPRPSLR